MLTKLKYRKLIYFNYGIFDQSDFIHDNIGGFIKKTNKMTHFSYPSDDDFIKFKNIVDYFEKKQKLRND